MIKERFTVTMMDGFEVPVTLHRCDNGKYVYPTISGFNLPDGTLHMEADARLSAMAGMYACHALNGDDESKHISKVNSDNAKNPRNRALAVSITKMADSFESLFGLAEVDLSSRLPNGYRDKLAGELNVSIGAIKKHSEALKTELRKRKNHIK
jgi:hypothetical protein